MARNSHINGLFARISETDFRKHFRSMSPLALKAYIVLDLAYWKGDRTGQMPIAQRWLAGEVGCDPKTATRLIGELCKGGLLRQVRRGNLGGGPPSSRISWFRLTWHPDKTDEGNFPSLTEEKVERSRRNVSFVETAVEVRPEEVFNSKTANGLSVSAIVNSDGSKKRTYSSSSSSIHYTPTQRTSIAQVGQITAIARVVGEMTDRVDADGS